MAVKIFQENHEPLELELRDRNGKSHVVQTLLLTSGDIKEFELMGQGKSKKKFKTKTEEAHWMLIKACGKNEEFWEKFSLTLLNDIMNYLIEEFKKKQEKMNG
jgi:hypothetical protein